MPDGGDGMIGYMTMPADFKYKSIFLKGRPQHKEYDPFRRKHPSMEHGRRAKIFAPFDALKGFSDAVASKETLYENQRELDDEVKEQIDHRLGVLCRLTFNSSLARDNHVVITVTYFVPCADPTNAAYGSRGQYVTLTGMCQRVGLHHLYVGTAKVSFRDIVSIEGEAFKNEWDEYCEYEDTGWDDAV